MRVIEFEKRGSNLVSWDVEYLLFKLALLKTKQKDTRLPRKHNRICHVNETSALLGLCNAQIVKIVPLKDRGQEVLAIFRAQIFVCF